MSTWIPTLLREIGTNPPPSIPDESLLSAALTDIILGVATHAQSAALLTCLHFTKLDHNAHVISAFAKTMREHALKVHRADLGKKVPSDAYLVDIVGTGGDGWGTFNASTSAAIIAAGAGCYICKHGNKAATSPTGSADLLTSLGAHLAPLTPRHLHTVFSQTRFAFLLAPTYHPGMAHVAPVRKEIGIRTIFNILGPLCNPADIDARVVGVSSKELGETFAETLRLMGVKRAMVVCGFEGLDEISPQGKTHVWRLDENSNLEYFSIEPADFGLPPHPTTEVKSGTPSENAALLLKLLDGQVQENDAILDFVLLNAAALLVCAEKAKDWKDGVRLARESINSGSARKSLDGFVKGSTEVADTVTRLRGRPEQVVQELTT